MRMVHKISLSLPLLLLLSACSEAPKPVVKKEPAKPPEPVSALTAVYKMYQQARGWAPDCKILRVGSLDLKEVPSQGGKAGAWEATFVSEGSRLSRRFTFSTVDLPASSLPLGVAGSPQDSWNGGGQAEPFYIQALKIDSTAAYETAMKKGADYATKHTNMPVIFLLEKTKRFPNPAWRVVWGESVATSSFSVYVDATLGDYLQTMH
jgi:hypothetical protein